MRLAFLLSTCLLLSSPLLAQYGGPRYFWDIPSLYVFSPSLTDPGDNLRVGVGAETTINLATHWTTVRAGGGASFSLIPASDDVENTFRTFPYFLAEGGAGFYRSNGNQCSQSHQNAFTAIALAGVRYDIQTRSVISLAETPYYGFNYYFGVELGYFFIRDMFRNTEFILRANYFPELDALSGQLGMRVFLNLREMGR